MQLLVGGRYGMGRSKKVRVPLPPIWRISAVRPAGSQGAGPDRPAGGPGRVISRLRTGCHWSWLPKEYPDDSTVHRHFQRWVERGVLDRVWATVREACEDLGGCNWEWQAVDCALGKARLGGRTWAPTPRIGPRTG